MENKEQPQEKKKQKISVSYTLKSFAENIHKFRTLGLIDEKQDKILTEMHQKILQQWMLKEFTTMK